MKYSYSFLDIAQQEYEEALIWYLEKSPAAAEGFVKAVDAALNLICDNPKGWRNEYEDYHELGLKKYPFNLIYSIEQDEMQVVIKSVYHQSRNPTEKYKK